MGRPSLPLGTYGTISAKKRPNGAWRASAQFRDLDGITRTVTREARTKALAENKLREALMERATPTGTDALNGETTMSALADLYFAALRAEESLRENTIAGYESIWNNDLKHRVGALKLREVTTARLDTVLRAIKSDASDKSKAKHGDTDDANNGSPRARKAKTVLSMMMKYAVQMDAIRYNPVGQTTTFKKTKKKVRALTVPQVKSVFSLITAWETAKRPGPKSNRDLSDSITLMCATGVRVGECLGARWSDFTQDGGDWYWTVSGTVIVPKSKKGKSGGKVYRQEFGKSDASTRSIKLPRWAVDMLLRRRETQNVNDIDAVFPTRKGTWLQPDNLWRQWRRIRSETEFEWVTSHVLRKTVGTIVDEAAGTDAAAALLGHSDPNITRAYYVQKAPVAPDVTAALNDLGAALLRAAEEDDEDTED